MLLLGASTDSNQIMTNKKSYLNGHVSHCIRTFQRRPFMYTSVSMVSIFSLPAIWYSLISMRDGYNGPPLPQPIERENVLFSTPVLQSMQQFHISEEEILKLIKSHPDQEMITDGSRHLSLRNNPKTQKDFQVFFP